MNLLARWSAPVFASMILTASWLAVAEQPEPRDEGRSPVAHLKAAGSMVL